MEMCLEPIEVIALRSAKSRNIEPNVSVLSSPRYAIYNCVAIDTDTSPW